MTKIDPSVAGKKGGQARASKLSPEQRSDIAARAARARWEKGSQHNGVDDIARAICGGNEPLRVGDAEIPCYVLDDERRVIGTRGMMKALGLSIGGGVTRLVGIAEQFADNYSGAKDLTTRLKSPIEFIVPSGGIGRGYEADVLVNLCEVVLEARRAGKVTKRYEHIAHAAEVVLSGFAVVGVVALIDEATGYQEYRRRLELAEILDKYLDDHLNKWTKTFPDDFYREFFRLKGWDYEDIRAGDVKPAEVGTFTREEVYRRLHPGIVEELERNNPYVVPGRRMHKHHQWLTKEVGHAALEKHIAQIVVIMKLSNDWLDFESKLQKVLPKASDTAFLCFIDTK